MEQSNRGLQSTNGRQLLLSLYQQRDALHEGSNAWRKIQDAIDKIVAQNYLEYLNR